MTQRAAILFGLLLMIGAPLAGGWMRGLDPAFFEFPPLTRYIRHAPFSPPVFALFSALAVGAALMLIRPRWFGFRVRRASEGAAHDPDRFPAGRVEGKAPHPERAPGADSEFGIRHSPFPSWFWLGLALAVVSWLLAWGRFEGLGPVREHTFFTLWLGYILVVDGLVFRRTGTSPASRSAGSFTAAFPVSAALWWYFEFVNRFVQNWWYDGVTHFSALHYLAYGTLCFSTVIPAILETADLLASFRWFRLAYREGPCWRVPARAGRRAVMAGGIAALVAMALWPNPLFFLTWLAPLAVLSVALAQAGTETPFTAMRRGDYSGLFRLAAAALVCGFFWEMWNFFSLPKWRYSVPYVNVLRLFEMPAAGFTGYLPFGPFCWCWWRAAQRLAGRDPER
jgi:hypothetical protein